MQLPSSRNNTIFFNLILTFLSTKPFILLWCFHVRLIQTLFQVTFKPHHIAMVQHAAYIFNILTWFCCLPESKAVQNQDEELTHHWEAAGRCTSDRTQTPGERGERQRRPTPAVWSITAPFCPSGAGASAACMLGRRERALSPKPQSAQINDLIGSGAVLSLCWGSSSDSDHHPSFRSAAHKVGSHGTKGLPLLSLPLLSCAGRTHSCCPAETGGLSFFRKLNLKLKMFWAE